MNKLTMSEFLHTYAQNLHETLFNHGYGINNLTIECSCCPFKEACQKASDNGDETSCGEFIKAQLIDGADYKA